MPASAAAANAAAAGAAARAAGARIARRVLPSGSLEAAGRQYSLDLTSRARAEARTARARPAASRRRRNMATVQPLRRRKRLAGSAVCRRGGSFGVLSPSQGAAERVRNRDDPPPQPRPVQAPLVTAMRSPFGAPGGRSKLGRAPMGGGCVLLAPHRAPSVRTGACTEGRLAQGLSRGRSAPSAVSRSCARVTNGQSSFSY